MSKPFRGEAALTAGEVAYTLTLNIGVITELEDATGLGLSEIIAAVQESPKMRLIQSIFCAALQPKHKGTTMEQTAEIMSDAGLEDMLDALKRVFEAAMPEVKKGAANPPKKKAVGGSG